MNDIVLKRLYLHGDDVDPMVTDTTISVQHSRPDVVAIIRGQTIGEIVKTSHGWLNYELDKALSAATATIRNIILQEFLRLKSFAPWENCDNMVSVVMASQTIYLTFDRPLRSPITFSPSEIESWTPVINNSQELFCIGKGIVMSGSPQGGTIQFPYSMKD